MNELSDQDKMFGELYSMLLGSRLQGTELFIPDFGTSQYEDLLESLLEILVMENVIRGNYFEWLYNRADAYHKQRLRHRKKKYAIEDFYDPFLAKSPEDYTTREQLALIKFYLYRRVYCSWKDNRRKQSS